MYALQRKGKADAILGAGIKFPPYYGLVAGDGIEPPTRGFSVLPH